MAQQPLPGLRFEHRLVDPGTLAKDETQRCSSDWKVLGDHCFRFHVYPREWVLSETMGVSLECARPLAQPDDRWSTLVRCSFTLVHGIHVPSNITCSFEKTFSQDCREHGIKNMVLVRDVLRDYVKRSSLLFRVLVHYINETAEHSAEEQQAASGLEQWPPTTSTNSAPGCSPAATGRPPRSEDDGEHHDSNRTGLPAKELRAADPADRTEHADTQTNTGRAAHDATGVNQGVANISITTATRTKRDVPVSMEWVFPSLSSQDSDEQQRATGEQVPKKTVPEPGAAAQTNAPGIQQERRTTNEPTRRKQVQASGEAAEVHTPEIERQQRTTKEVTSSLPAPTTPTNREMTDGPLVVVDPDSLFEEFTDGEYFEDAFDEDSDEQSLLDQVEKPFGEEYDEESICPDEIEDPEVGEPDGKVETTISPRAKVNKLETLDSAESAPPEAKGAESEPEKTAVVWTDSHTYDSTTNQKKWQPTSANGDSQRAETEGTQELTVSEAAVSADPPVTNAENQEQEQESNATRPSIYKGLPLYESSWVADPTKQVVVVDGGNVAYDHGHGHYYSVRGIKLVLDYYRRRRHETVAIVTRNWSGSTLAGESRFGPEVDTQLLEELRYQGLVWYSPTGENDDHFALRYAYMKNALLVSNDWFRKEIGNQATDVGKERLRHLVSHNRVAYMFIKDTFLPRPDPRMLTEHDFEDPRAG